MFAPRYLLILTATIFLSCPVALVGPSGAAVRVPVWAGKFYPENREALDRLIRRLTSAAEQDPAANLSRTGLRALMMPHAGYAFSGLTAAHAAMAIDRNRFDRVVLLGPDHRVGFRNAAVTGASHWQTPLGVGSHWRFQPDAA